MSCIINSCTVSYPSHGIVGRQFCHALIAAQSLLFFTRMTCNNSCAVASPNYGIVGRQGCHALLIPVQFLLLSTGLWGGKDVMH